MSNIQKIIFELAFLLIIAILMFALGFFIESQRWETYKQVQEAQYNDQLTAVKQENQTIKENADASLSSYTTGIQSITDYYKSHPVRVLSQPTTTLPGTIDNTKGTDDTSTKLYACTYNPRDTEIIATQLDQLQKLLTNDKVIVK